MFKFQNKTASTNELNLFVKIRLYNLIVQDRSAATVTFPIDAQVYKYYRILWRLELTFQTTMILQNQEAYLDQADCSTQQEIKFRLEDKERL